jgi:hypothetical protein
MAEGRLRERWNHTASILAVILNVNRGKNDRAVKPSELNPYEQKRQEKPAIKIKMSDLKPFFEKVKKSGSGSGD